jgi:hypothetical protein
MTLVSPTNPEALIGLILKQYLNNLWEWERTKKDQFLHGYGIFRE